MRKKVWITFIILLIIILSYYLFCGKVNKDVKIETDEQLVANLVMDFGNQLKMVPLIAPEEEVIKSLNRNYQGLVTPNLLSKWSNDPTNAPGRVGSSPWPDRIQIISIYQLDDESYLVSGDIIEITSTEVGTNKYAAKRHITLMVIKVDGEWLIDAVTIGAYN